MRPVGLRRRGMAATRYCGDAKITMRIDPTDREGWLYHCSVTCPTCHCGSNCKPYRVDIRLAVASRHLLAEDNPGAFDEIAKTAMSFASADGADVVDHSEVDDCGNWSVLRKKRSG